MLHADGCDSFRGMTQSQLLSHGTGAPLPRGLLIIALLAVAACTATPQVLPITPDPQLRGDSARGGGRTMAVAVVDARGSNVIGLRDPADPASVITTPPETLRNIQLAIEKGYEQLGFVLVPLGDDADIALEVRLTDLGYTRAAGGVVRKLKTLARFEVTSVMRSQTVNADYSDGRDKDTVVRPTLEANAGILNKHINGALAKMLSDARLTTE